jgi:hypothetical protein
MRELISENWIGLLGLVLAAVAIIASVVAARRWGNRRNRVLFQTSVTPLMEIEEVEASNGGRVEVRVNGAAVWKPHLVSILLTNVGPHDVTTAHFDSGDPLTVRMNGAFLATNMRASLTMPSGEQPELEARTKLEENSEPWSEIYIRPKLFRVGDIWKINVLTSGQPSFKIISSLIDTDIEESVVVKLPQPQALVTKKRFLGRTWAITRR